MLLAMVISQLLSMYQSVRRRDAAAMLIRSSIIGGLWREWESWFVDHDRVLLSLTIAPYPPWSSDRSMVERNGPRIRRHNRSRG